MLALVRRRLAMASRVRDFFRAHPSDEPSHQEALGRFEELLARADALALQQRAGVDAQRAAVARRSELRQVIRKELLPHLVQVGQMVAIDRPDLAGRFRVPRVGIPLRDFSDMTKAMIALATADRDLFVAKGLSRALLDELTQTFDAFERATTTAHDGRRGHVGATADIVAVTRELLMLVDQLDKLNSFRFRKDRELKASWESAREVVGPFGISTLKVSEDGATPPSGGMAPAA